jgi:hypothetical protein
VRLGIRLPRLREDLATAWSEQCYGKVRDHRSDRLCCWSTSLRRRLSRCKKAAMMPIMSTAKAISRLEWARSSLDQELFTWQTSAWVAFPAEDVIVTSDGVDIVTLGSSSLLGPALLASPTTPTKSARRKAINDNPSSKVRKIKSFAAAVVASISVTPRAARATKYEASIYRSTAAPNEARSSTENAESRRVRHLYT